MRRAAALGGSLRRRSGTLMFGLILMGLTLGALGHVAVQAQKNEVAVKLGRAQATYETLLTQRRHKQIEIGRLKSPGRLVDLARGRLGMTPDPAGIRVVPPGRRRDPATAPGRPMRPTPRPGPRRETRTATATTFPLPARQPDPPDDSPAAPGLPASARVVNVGGEESRPVRPARPAESSPTLAPRPVQARAAEPRPAVSPTPPPRPVQARAAEPRPAVSPTPPPRPVQARVAAPAAAGSPFPPSRAREPAATPTPAPASIGGWRPIPRAAAAAEQAPPAKTNPADRPLPPSFEAPVRANAPAASQRAIPLQMKGGAP